MLFEFEKEVLTNPLLKLINLTNDDRQKEFIKLVSKSCQKGDTVVYILKLDGNICGFIALSASKIDSIPCVSVDYLFVVEEYRKKSYEDLDNKKISEYLIFYSLKTANEIRQSLDLRWVALIADNEELEHYYIHSLNFTKYKSQKDNTTYLSISIK